MYDYEGLNKKLLERGLKKSELTSILKISSRTIAKIAKREKLADQVMDKLCGYFSCDKEDLCRAVSPNPVLQRLREEKEHREEQTRRIFETNTLGAEDDLAVDDIIETVNHFRAIDYCIEVAEEALSEEIIKHLHYLLKMRTQAERLVWFQIGDYKQRPNVVGGTKTSTPKEVPAAMKALITAYLAKENVSLADIVEFHYRFEKIHPFQDGNGRVGRLIAFKECLKQNLVPFIIEDRKKYYYYRGLKEYESQPGFLLDTCLDGQDTFRALLELFEVETPPNSLK